MQEIDIEGVDLIEKDEIAETTKIQKIICEFCKEIIKKEEINTHVKENLLSHIMILYRENIQEREKFEIMTTEIKLQTEEVDQLREDFDELKIENDLKMKQIQDLMAEIIRLRIENALITNDSNSRSHRG